MELLLDLIELLQMIFAEFAEGLLACSLHRQKLFSKFLPQLLHFSFHL
jgi:hypothetical protein